MPTKQNWLDLGVIFLASYCIKILWLLTVSKWIRERVGITRSELADPDLVIIQFFAMVVLVYPIIEELLFRYFLDKKKLVTALLLAVFFAVVLLEALKFFPIENATFKKAASVLALGIPIIVAVVIYAFLEPTGKLDQMFTKAFPVLFYFSALSFGLLHIYNFSTMVSKIWIVPLLVPFLISGVALGFARMKLGLWASICLHIAYNGTTFVFDQVLGI